MNKLPDAADENIKKTIRIARESISITPAVLAANAIKVDISDRRGLKNEWSQISPDIRQEILDIWVKIITECFRAEEMK